MFNLFSLCESIDLYLFKIGLRNLSKLAQNTLLITVAAYLIYPLRFREKFLYYRPMIVTVLISLLFLIPSGILSSRYTPGKGLTKLIGFGRNTQKPFLPEIYQLKPAMSSKYGYDGQYYAQLSIDPFLKQDKTKEALDLPQYRARRIGLPFLAYFLGMGKPWQILNIYSVLNFVFWILLFIFVIRYAGVKDFRSLFLAMAMLWSTGTLVSLERALTDFPAVVTAVAAVLVSGRSWIIAGLLFSYSGLIKETSALSFPVLIEPGKTNRKRLILSLLVCIIPLLAWYAYIYLRLGSSSGMGSGNFSLPFYGFIMKVSSAVTYLSTGREGILGIQLLFELLCPFSLLVQALYLAFSRRYESAEWRLGAGFAFLFAFLGSGVWEEQNAYARVLLPLTFSYNLLIYRYEKKTRFALFFISGNVGMFWLAYMFFI